MKASILAAGLGTRLRPLTTATAKPMMPVANKPIMEHVIELLARQEFDKLFVNIHYQPETIRRYFGNGRRWGVDLTYLYEEDLMGTAGGLKRMERLLNDDTFVVFSSDVLTDIDLEPLVKFHRKRDALATLALASSNDAGKFGAVEIADDGAVTAFHEKPAWIGDATALVSCGIYVFEPEVFDLIPPDTFYDFGHDLFPRLFRMGKRLYGYEHGDYWMDIGRLEDYRRGNFDALTGKVAVTMPGDQIDEGIWIGRDTAIHETAETIAPLCIGNSCVVGRNARLIGPVVIGNGNIIGEGSIIQDCIKVARGRIDDNLAIIGGVISHQR